MAKSIKEQTNATTQEQDSRVEIPKISFEDYTTANPTNPGLIASFKYEVEKDGKKLEDIAKSSEEWKKALEAQKNRTYY